MNFLLASGDPVSHVAQHMLVKFGDGIWTFPIFSNVILMQLLGAAILVYFLPRAVQMRAGTDAVGRLVPRGFGTAIEQICIALRDAVFRPNLGKYSDRYTPFLWSLFFFILIANVLGLFPLSDWFGAINPTLGHTIGGTSTANIYVTAALAAVAFVLIVGSGLYYNGLDYIKHFFIGPWWIWILTAPIEAVGVVFKCMALCIRLMANMVAGHILLAVLLSFVNDAGGLASGMGFGIAIPVIAGSVMVYFLEILVAFLHAFIFTMLTAVFLGMAVNIHHDDDHAEHDEHAAAEAHGAPAH